MSTKKTPFFAASLATWGLQSKPNYIFKSYKAYKIKHVFRKFLSEAITGKNQNKAPDRCQSESSDWLNQYELVKKSK